MNSINPVNRRRFLQLAAAAGSAFSAGPLMANTNGSGQTPPLSVNIFSKHLQFLDYTAMAQAAAQMGFDGVDLTVRPNGHVEPHRVASDLPRALEAIHNAGLSCEMITTAVERADDPVDQRLLTVAAKEGVRFYRMNWFSYPKGEPLPKALVSFREQVIRLSELNDKLGIVGCYQNHAGTLVGSSLWEVWQMLQGANPEHMGIQFDIRHAMVEGGLSWPNSLELALPHIKTIVAKDFRWSTKDGRNLVVDTPLGQGSVDFAGYFQVLKAQKLQVPVSLHIEHDLGGAQWGKRDIERKPRDIFRIIERDLDALRTLWSQA